MTRIEFIRPDNPTWARLLSEVQGYDFYHLPAYHTMAEVRGEGEAVMCAYREGEFVIAIPLLLRRIKDIQGVEDCLALDATSVYGYPGPIVSRPPSPEIVRRFQSALKRALKGRNVVAVFSRLHPLLPQVDCLRGLGWLEPAGLTTCIDLRLAEEEQMARYRQNHRYGISKLQRRGVVCFADSDFQHLGHFIDLYYETMTRVGARRHYLFDRRYFDELRGAVGQSLHLYICYYDGQPISGGLFVHTGDIVQYHLGGTDGRYLKWAPTKLVFDTVRRDFSGRASWFHLGGGLGAQSDSLFHFKKGFGGEAYLFVLWKWVVQERTYEALCRQRFRAEEELSGTFFPRYRM